jgi:hypothetical protein
MEKSTLFKGLAIFNFALCILLFLLHQTGKLDAFFPKYSTTTTLSSSKSITITPTFSSSKSIPVLNPAKSLGAIKEGLNAVLDKVLDKVVTAFPPTRDSFIQKDVKWANKNVQDSIKKEKQKSDLAKERVYMSSSKYYVVDGVRAGGGSLPPPLDIDSLKKYIDSLKK